jgi:hypothetical protein
VFGLLIGVAAALAVRLLTSSLYGLSPTDAVSFATAAAVRWPWRLLRAISRQTCHDGRSAGRAAVRLRVAGARRDRSMNWHAASSIWTV